MMMFSLDGSPNAMSPAESSAWYDVIGRFRVAAAQFADARHALAVSPIPDDATLAEERASLVTRGSTIESTVRYIRQALDDVSAALSGAWSSVTGAWDWIADRLGTSHAPAVQSLQGLGLPLIPIAAVVAAIAMVTAFLSDYAAYASKVRTYNEAIARGLPPEQAAAVVQSLSRSDNFFTALGSTLPWVAGLVIVGLVVMRRKAS